MYTVEGVNIWCCAFLLWKEENYMNKKKYDGICGHSKADIVYSIE